MNLSPDELKQKLKQPLPGITSHIKMAPRHRVEELSSLASIVPLARNSAVLILLFPVNRKLKTVFIQRSVYEGVHSGQISFPGGKHEKSDKDFEATALRETFEEIGVEPDKIEILAQLTDFYIPPSNFLVKVFVGYSSQQPVFTPDHKEVQSILEVDIDDFYDSRNIADKEFYSTSRKTTVNAPCFLVNGMEIWGATAMMLSELLDVLN